MGEDAALEEGVELVLDEARQLRSGAGFGVRDEAGLMLMHQAIQRCLQAAGIWVLVSGTLQVSKNGIGINTVAQPGAVVGEISVLPGAPYGATVRTIQPSVLRHAANGRALLDSHPAISRLVAVGLAERLNFVTTYLVDLKQQYGTAPGLSKVADVLRELSQHQAKPATSMPAVAGSGTGDVTPAENSKL